MSADKELADRRAAEAASALAAAQELWAAQEQLAAREAELAGLHQERASLAAQVRAGRHSGWLCSGPPRGQLPTCLPGSLTST